MKILSIETSCDETAVSIIEASGGLAAPSFTVLSNLVLSQIKLHEQYGGVFPNLAKREHSKNLGPLLKKALQEAGLLKVKKNTLDAAVVEKIKNDLVREPELAASLIELFETSEKPALDLIAVTFGPGLEPALWVGINAGKVLAEVWGLPLMPINHMEGHIASVLLNSSETASGVEFPAVALLISGGHTEIVFMPDWLQYKVIGQTRDDAVGEAFDKVARMLGLPYPGGPQISALAAEARTDDPARIKNLKNPFTFPRPMINSGDYDFSFSGLKTSVLYTIRDLAKTGPAELDVETKKQIAVAFEDAVIETLVTKTRRAIEEFAPRTLILAGGVTANTAIREAFEKLVTELNEQGNEQGAVQLLIPGKGLSTDNALMIALAAYVRHIKNPSSKNLPGEDYEQGIIAQGNVQL